MDKKITKYLLFAILIINVCILPVKASTITNSNAISVNYKIEDMVVRKEFKKNNKDTVNIEPLSSMCSDANVKRIFRAMGYILLISKIIVPIVLMVGTIMNYTKAMTANDEKGIKDATTKFAKAGAAALLIFFLPSIINLALSLVEDEKYETNDYVNCRKCLFDVRKCK